MEFKWQESRSATRKLIAVGLIVVGLLVPLSLLKGLISERTQMRDQAVGTVAVGWGGSLTAGGPMLRIPFDVVKRLPTGESITETHQIYVLADELNVDGVLNREHPRRVGNYEVPVFLARFKLSGQFRMSDVRSAVAGLAPGTTVHWSDARLRLPMSDVRSMRELRLAQVADHALALEPAFPSDFAAVEARLDLSAQSSDALLPFSFEIVLAGTQSLAIVPTAVTSRVTLAADWPDPQFQGAFLPAHYTVDARGFRADWQVLALNRDYAQAWVDRQVDVNKLTGSSFGVALYQSVDIYQRVERAVKYALLFISLTYLSFFAWEMIGGFELHAVQYLFIGLSLSTFYLLLIALSEHCPFWLSYLLGAAALVALLGVYMGGVLDSRRRGMVVSMVMTLTYALLYMLVISERYALLMGAIALFAVLATAMIATRHVRWTAPGAAE